MDSSVTNAEIGEITAAQLRAARALLGWSRQKAAVECGVGWATLGRLERAERIPRTSTLDGILQAYMSQGVTFFRAAGHAGVAMTCE